MKSAMDPFSKARPRLSFSLEHSVVSTPLSSQFYYPSFFPSISSMHIPLSSCHACPCRCLCDIRQVTVYISPCLINIHSWPVDSLTFGFSWCFLSLQMFQAQSVVALRIWYKEIPSSVVWLLTGFPQRLTRSRRNSRPCVLHLAQVVTAPWSWCVDPYASQIFADLPATASHFYWFTAYSCLHKASRGSWTFKCCCHLIMCSESLILPSLGRLWGVDSHEVL